MSGTEPSLGDLNTVMRGQIKAEEPLGPHTTLGIGGPCALFLRPADEDSLCAAVVWARECGLPLACIGRGSNLLVADEGWRGVVVSLMSACSWVRFAGTRVEVGAGYSLMRLVRETVERALGGLEGLAGVPGTVGGAVAMNAGTTTGDIGRVTRAVRVLTTDGEVQQWPGESLAFGYRRSRLQEGGLVALSATLELSRGDPEALGRYLAESAVRRRRTQPLDLPNAGSVWINPPGEHAGRLIEVAGCKGWQVGDAQVSLRHANFIVNLGHARAADVVTLMARVRRAVAERFGVELEPELRWLGGQHELEALLDQALA